MVEAVIAIGKSLGVKTLAEFTDGGPPLITPDQSYPLTIRVTLAGANTTQGTQTVQATAPANPGRGPSGQIGFVR